MAPSQDVHAQLTLLFGHTVALVGERRIKRDLAALLAERSGKLVPLDEASQALGLVPADVTYMVQGDLMFHVTQLPTGKTGIALDLQAVREAAAKVSRLGPRVSPMPEHLAQRNVPPTGYIDGLYPIRPGQPECRHYRERGVCAFKHKCHFNHQIVSTFDRTAAASWRRKSPEGEDAPPASGSHSRPNGGASGGAVQEMARDSQDGAPVTPRRQPHQEQQQQQQTQQPQPSAAPSATTLQATAESAAVPGTAAPAAAAPAAAAEPAAPAATAAEPAAAPAAAATAAEPAAAPAAAAAAVPAAAGPPARPGAPVCIIYLTRGFCPAGAACPCDHPARGSGRASVRSAVAAVAAAAAVPAAPCAVTAAAANSQAGPPQSQPRQPALSAALQRPLQPPTPQPALPQPAPQASPAAPLPARHAPQSLAAPQPQPQPQPHAPAVNQPPPPQQQQPQQQPQPPPQQQQQQQQPPPPPPPSQQQQQQQQPSQQQQQQQQQPMLQLTLKGPHAKSRVWPRTGTTSSGMPQRAGASNCCFYMYCGDCRFKAGCNQHHPDQALLHPKFTQTGKMSLRWPPELPAPYGRILAHLGRVWDYQYCQEAQLKTWLARHLLAAANPGRSSWSRSAGLPAAPATHPGYICSLQEAEAVLTDLWAQQPDAAAAARPMPWAGRLEVLLAADPYFMLSPGSVRLEMVRLKETLNW